MTLFSNFRSIERIKVGKTQPFPPVRQSRTGKSVRLLLPNFHIQTVIFSGETRRRIFPPQFSQTQEKQKSSWSASFFFKKFQLFFCGLADAGKFWVLGQFIGWRILWFWGFCRFRKPSETAWYWLSNDLVSVLSMGKDFGRVFFSWERFIGIWLSCLAGMRLDSNSLTASSLDSFA